MKTNKIVSFCLVFGFFLSQSMPAFAATYYVAKTNCSDSYPGSLSQPWCTIQKAAATMVAGDTTYVRSGTYNGQITPQNSGSAGNWITYKVYPGDSVVINGNGADLGFRGIVQIDHKAYIEVDGFEITSCAGWTVGVMVTDASDHINLKNLKSHDVAGAGISVSWDTGQGYNTNILADNCEIYNSNSNGNGEALSISHADTFEIKNCKVHNIKGASSAVGVQKEGIDAKVGSVNGLIHNNEVYDAVVGIYVGEATPGTGVKNISIYSNYVHDCTMTGIASAAETGQTLDDISIYNNVVTNNAYVGIAIVGAAQNGPSAYTRIKIYSNTIYDSGTLLVDTNNYGKANGMTLNNCYVVNNIVYGSGISVRGTGAIPAGLTIDHNLVYGGSGIGTNLITSDPLFKNPSTLDFGLKSGSPAIDAASTVVVPSTDYIGTSRPQGAGYDIGAYEYVNGGCTPTTCNALGDNCGSVSDGCGGTLSCGTCSSGQTCTSNKCVASASGAIIINHTNTDATKIPAYWLEKAKALTLHYAHTSHGGQLLTGAQAWMAYNSSYKIGIRAGTTEGLPAVTNPVSLRVYDGTLIDTYTYPDYYYSTQAGIDSTNTIASTGHYNYSMFAHTYWPSVMTTAELNTYLNQMDAFEKAHPGMRFIYMTGHPDGTGSTGLLNQNNNLIRAYCKANNKVLYDYADIGSYDPSGVGYLDQGNGQGTVTTSDECAYSGGNWCNDWVAAHPTNVFTQVASLSNGCAHSENLNCALKGGAFWWMMARLAGWDGSSTCTPTTCAVLGDNCGTVSDGCGGTLSCGNCSTGYACSANKCVVAGPSVGYCAVGQSSVVKGGNVTFSGNATSGTYSINRFWFELNLTGNYSFGLVVGSWYNRSLNTSGLALGNYSMKCWVNDTQGNKASLKDGSFAVVTSPTTTTTRTTTTTLPPGTTTTTSTTSTVSSTTLTDLVLHLKLDDGSGVTAYDRSGYGLNGTLVGGPVWVSGVFGNALRFDGIDDYVGTANSSALILSDQITIAAWVEPASSQELCYNGAKGNYGVLSSASSNTGSASWSWQLRYGATTGCYLGFQFHTNPEGSIWVTVGQNLSAGQWYHVAATYNGTQIRSYLNGQLKETATMTAIAVDPQDRIFLGVDGWNDYFNGTLYDVRIYHRALSPAEISQLYMAATTTTTTTSSTTTTSLKIPGDADGDGLVNYNDLIILAASYGTQAGDTRYDSRADFNSDGVVDYEDLIVLAANYGG